MRWASYNGNLLLREDFGPNVDIARMKQKRVDKPSSAKSRVEKVMGCIHMRMYLGSEELTTMRLAPGIAL